LGDINFSSITGYPLYMQVNVRILIKKMAETLAAIDFQPKINMWTNKGVSKFPKKWEKVLFCVIIL